jgi:hypothetical protein
VRLGNIELASQLKMLGQHSLNMLENKLSQVGVAVAGSNEDKAYSAFKPWLT